MQIYISEQELDSIIMACRQATAPSESLQRALETLTTVKAGMTRFEQARIEAE